MNKVENLNVGLQYFQETIEKIDEMPIIALLKFYGKLKVLEDKAFLLKENSVIYTVQELEGKIEDKIIKLTYDF